MAVAPSKHHNMSSEDGMRPNERPAKRLKVSETPSRPNGLKPATLLNDSVSEESEIVNYGLSEDFDLRLFQKEALYRSLQEYKRQSEESNQRLEIIQSKALSLESASAAISASWNGLVGSIQSLFPSAADLLPLQIPDFRLQDTSENLAAYQSALQDSAQQTLSLVQNLLHTSPSTSAKGSEFEALSRKCASVQQELVGTQEALATITTQLRDAQLEASHSREAVRRLEKALERAKSATVAQLELRLTTDDRLQTHVSSINKSAKDGDDAQMAESPQQAKAETFKKDADTQPVLPINTSDDTALTEARILAEARYAQIIDLRSERTQLQNEIDELQLQIQTVSKDRIISSPEYTHLQAQLTSLQADLDTALAALQTAKEELSLASTGQTELREVVIREAGALNDELNRKLLGKEADLNRIRAQREELKADNAELKAREAEKFKSVEAIRVLANSKEDRMIALKSEIRRLRMKIAADKGDMNGVEFEAANDHDDQIAVLRADLQAAHALIESLKTQGADGGSAALGQGKELASLQQTVSRYEAAFGPLSTSPELKDLSDRLEMKEKRISELTANVKALEMSSGMLMSEIERLSQAWQQLESQSKDKLMNLAQNEERMTKLTTEKSKADNRYFAAMRAKEAIQAENQVLTKTLERHSKSIDVLAEGRAASLEQQANHDKEIALLQAELAAHQAKAASSDLERDGLASQAVAKDAIIQDLSDRLKQRTASFETEATERQRLGEQVGQLQRQVQKQTEKEAELVAAASSHASRTIVKGGSTNAQVAELEQYNADLNKMLKCTSCQIRYKSHVITRCYHLLCHECIESRLSNRQRKCPTCQMAFGSADVAAVYF